MAARRRPSRTRLAIIQDVKSLDHYESRRGSFHLIIQAPFKLLRNCLRTTFFMLMRMLLIEEKKNTQKLHRFSGHCHELLTPSIDL
jgi:hypothetical protein